MAARGAAAPPPPPAALEEEESGEGAREALAALSGLKVGAGAQGVKRPAPEASGGDEPAVGEGGAKRPAPAVGAGDGTVPPPPALVFRLLVPAAAVTVGGSLANGALEAAARATGAIVSLLDAVEGCAERLVELSSDAGAADGGEPPAQVRLRRSSGARPR